MSTAITTTDHNEIRQWVESHNGRPACVKGTGGKDDVGMIRIDFDAPEDGLQEISWDQWFEAFEANDLALLHSPDSRFNKLIARGGH